MTSVIKQDAIANILQSFIDGNINNPLLELEKIKVDDKFGINIKYYKYNKSINLPLANIIVEFQMSIYKMVALSLNGTTDLRFLSKEIKKDLEIPFLIEEGCSILKNGKELIPYIKEVLNTMPKNHRLYALIAIILSVVGPYTYTSYLDNYAKIETINQNADLHRLALKKLSESNDKYAEIIIEMEKNQLNQLQGLDESVEIGGNKFKSDDFQVIKKKKYPREKYVTKAYTISGRYTIIDINIKNQFVIFEGADEISEPVLKVYYGDENNLFSHIDGTIEKLSNAVYNKDKVYNINATVLDKGKEKEYTLQDMREITK